MDFAQPDLLRHRQSLAEVRRLVANAEGQLQSETARKAVITKQVGEAKGRKERKHLYDKFLEEMQAEAHSRNVGKFERLLSTLVNEIMPGQPPIGLDLGIKRGQPSLDIVSRVTADLSKDIYKHKGGALTNVVVLGLRMIALVRSRKRRFLILDESDCWTQSEKIPAFYNVVRDAAAKLGIQCVAISHWPTEKYGDGVNVARLSGNPEASTGTNINNNARRHQWTDEEEGFRFIRLINFQGYVNETLYLVPGMTVISGDNDLGKSSIVRAMRAMFYGDIDDGLIRDGERMCAVEIGLSGGRVLRWDRQIKRNPVNLWKLMNADGSVIDEEHETGGDLPDWVEKEFGITKVQGLDVHLMIQKEPVFLLQESPQVRATVLSVGQESSYISTMIQKHKDQVAIDNTTIREGEKEMSKLIDRLEKLEKAVLFSEKVEEAETLHEKVRTGYDKVGSVQRVLADISKARAVLETLEEKHEILAYLPETEALRGLQQSIRKTDAMVEILNRIVTCGRELTRATNTAGILSYLPHSMPEVRSSDRLIDLGRNIATSKSDVVRLEGIRDILVRLPQQLPVIRDATAAGEALKHITSASIENKLALGKMGAIKQKMADCEHELNEIVDEFGHSCPVCGTHIEDGSTFMAVHTHGVAA